MTDPLPDTWHSRDLPVLREVVRQYDATMRAVRVEDIEKATRLSEDDVQRAGIALSAAGLVDIKGAMQKKVLLFGGVTAEARRAAGAWPSAESIADRLLIELRDIAEYGSSEVEKTKARKALDGLGGFSRDVLVGVIGAAAGVGMQ